jgi:ATP-dependent DNA ligase
MYDPPKTGCDHERYPLIVEAAMRNRSSSFVIDGEAVLLGIDGISDFDGLRSRKYDHEASFTPPRIRRCGLGGVLM